MIVKPITAQSFRKDVEDFCKRFGMSRRNVGLLALNDPAFFLRLQKEISPSLVRVERIYDFMIEYEKTHEPVARIETAEEDE